MNYPTEGIFDMIKYLLAAAMFGALASSASADVILGGQTWTNTGTALSLDAVVPALTSHGFSEDVARLFEEMYAGLEHGRIVFEGNGACRPRGLVTLSEAVAGWL